ncbi:hypothetical protein OK016_01695 [Vibrio chagasii]|nr:hypothetical protein [Vibrio chagasii]
MIGLSPPHHEALLRHWSGKPRVSGSSALSDHAVLCYLMVVVEFWGGRCGCSQHRPYEKSSQQSSVQWIITGRQFDAYTVLKINIALDFFAILMGLVVME